MKRRTLLFGILLLGCLGFRTAANMQTLLGTEPIVRIGLDQDASTVTVRSAQEFSVQQQSTRSVKFSTVVAIDEAATNRVLTKSDLRSLMSIELDGGRVLVLPLNTRVRIRPASENRAARLQIQDRTYRGTIEVYANT